MPAQVYDADADNTMNARERAVSKNMITWFLFFTQPEDEASYAKSLKNLFNFRTFWPVILVYLAFSAVQTELTSTMEERDPFLTLTAATSLLNILLILIFTIAQLIDFLHSTSQSLNPKLYAASMYVLRKFMRGRMEDLIILLALLGQGFHQFSLITRDLCIGCGKIFTVVQCLEDTDRVFPLAHAFFGYVSIILLPVYFKSVQRHVILFCWLMYTTFIIAAYFIGNYVFQPSVILFILFFFVSIYEAERYKMTSYLLSKEALSFEKTKFLLEQEKGKIIQRKLHLALVDQILPRKVAEQIVAGKTVEPESFDEVTIFFSDVVGFTNICAAVKPIQVVRMLNELYTVMDYCCQQFPLYKVETIGDAYMVVGGLPERSKEHAQDVANFAILVSHAVQAVKSPVDGTPIRIRIGMHSGPVMAGVVGNLMPRYCLFGDTVNTASRMESNGEAGKIHCSKASADILIAENQHVLESRGEINIKGKGLMTTFWLQHAVDDNDASNELAVSRIMAKVRELLESNKEPDPSGRIALLSPTEDGEVAIDAGTISSRGSQRSVSQIPARPVSVTNISVARNSAISTATASGVELSLIDADAPEDDAGISTIPNKGVSSGSTRGTSINPSLIASPRLTQTDGISNTKKSVIITNPSKDSSTIKGNGLIARNLNRFSSSGKRVHHDVDFSGARILVVEDSSTQRKVLVQRLHLADRSWDVSYAISGEDALQKLKAGKFQFDIVLVDENLSMYDGLYGHELVQVMRESFAMTNTIIIACTSNAEGSRQDLLDSGVDEVWSKPPPAAEEVKLRIDHLLIARMNATANKAGLDVEIQRSVPTSPPAANVRNLLTSAPK